MRRRDESGMAAAELVLLTPLALAVLGFLVLAGRLSTVRADVAAASRDAARAATQISMRDAVAIIRDEKTATNRVIVGLSACRCRGPSTLPSGE